MSLLNLAFSHLLCFNPLSFALHQDGDNGKILPLGDLCLLAGVRTLLASYLVLVPNDCRNLSKFFQIPASRANYVQRLSIVYNTVITEGSLNFVTSGAKLGNQSDRFNLRTRTT